jgi:hypothetical protein
MQAAIALSQLLTVLLTSVFAPSDDDKGAVYWESGWLPFATHRKAEPGSPAGNATNGGRLSNCRSIAGADQIHYVQCDAGPNGTRNIFNAVTPGDPDGPALTPEMLMEQALHLLKPPAPRIATAPPRGKNGYVGLRQFFWAEPAQWHAISKKAAAGSVWAEVTAAPSRLTIQPGAGQATLTCPGLGVPYDQDKSPDDQNIECTHLFTESSAGLPGSQYQVRVSLVWSANWTGSGRSGGPLAPITTSTTFPLRIGEAPALVGRSS